jgi:hypothetical protein
MPKYELRVGGHIDVVNKDELWTALSDQAKMLIAESQGVKHIDFTATATIVGGSVTIPSATPGNVGQLQIPFLGPEDGFYWSLQRVTVDGLTKYNAAQTVNTPAVPASTVAQQNGYSFPVNVTISGGTLTAVVVNGVTVGTTDGTYIVPAAGTISVTYSVAPTWAWAAAPGTNLPTYNTDYLVVYKNFAAGYNRLFSLSAAEEWEFPGSHAGMLKPGDVLIVTGSGLTSTGTLTLSGEALSVPAEMVYKLVR